MKSNIAELLQTYNRINAMEHKDLFKALILLEMINDIDELNLEDLEGANDRLEECYSHYMSKDGYTTIIHPKIIEKYLCS